MAQESITPRAKDYAQWYQDVIAAAELAQPAEVVKGCMVVRPNGWAIWEKLQAALDSRFKASGHQNAAFPLLIPMSFIQREAQHVEGFKPELAVVTHAGGKELEEPYVVRPTSETIIGHFFAKWVDSWRDLPLLINQWGNVMRWELRTRMFLRTGEFWWQEGHTCHATHEEAREEVQRMLDIYRDVAESEMAMPVVQGVKTDSERFAGAIETRCIEAMMQDGKALQAGTSHDLGQNFAKAFNITFQSQAGDRQHVWQTSWGASTRLVGALIMTHSDDNGLVLPPRVAFLHVVIVPIWKTDAEKARLLEVAQRLAAELRDDGLSVKVDDRDGLKPGAKYYEWERKGVPLRLELGPRDLDSQSVMAKLRVGQDQKQKLALADLGVQVGRLLDEMQAGLLERARAFRAQNTVEVDTWDEFASIFEGGGSKFVWAHWDGRAETEAAIKDATKATIRCLALPGQGPAVRPGRCIKTGQPSAQRVLFAKNY